MHSLSYSGCCAKLIFESFHFTAGLRTTILLQDYNFTAGLQFYCRTTILLQDYNYQKIQNYINHFAAR